MITAPSQAPSSTDTDNLVQDNAPYTTDVIMTPAVAATLLAVNTHNRTLRDAMVARYARDMASGRWQELADDTIKVSRAGNLLNGQHRLNAVLRAGVSVRMTITYNLPDEAQLVMDSGVGRTTGDALGLEDVPNRNLAAAASRGVLLLSESREPTRAEIVEFYHSRSLLIQEGIRYIQACRSEGLPQFSAYAVVYTILAERRLDKATQFMDAIISGADLAPGDPRMALRRHLLGRKQPLMSNATGLRRGTWPFFHAWNLWLSGRQVNRIVTTNMPEASVFLTKVK